MNETEWIFWGVFSLAIGYGIARFFKNIGRLYRKWGLLISYFAFPTILVMLLYSGAIIADFNNIVLSMVFAGGFLIGMVKRAG